MHQVVRRMRSPEDYRLLRQDLLLFVVITLIILDYLLSLLT